MSTNRQHIASAARRTQSARRNYWAAVADGNTFRTERAAQALKISEGFLIREAGSAKAARAAEAAYIDSLVEQ